MSADAGPSSSRMRFFAWFKRTSRLSVGGGLPRTNRNCDSRTPCCTMTENVRGTISANSGPE